MAACIELNNLDKCMMDNAWFNPPPPPPSSSLYYPILLKRNKTIVIHEGVIFYICYGFLYLVKYIEQCWILYQGYVGVYTYIYKYANSPH